MLNTVFLSVTFDTFSTYKFFELETALCNSQKIVQRKKYIRNVHMKTLNQHCPNVHVQIFVTQFRSCSNANRLTA